MIRQASRQAGFTLVEMMVGLVIMTVVALALVGGTLVGYRTISVEARTIAANQTVSNASLALVRDLSSATTVATTPPPPVEGKVLLSTGQPV